MAEDSGLINLRLKSVQLTKYKNVFYAQLPLVQLLQMNLSIIAFYKSCFGKC